MITVRFPFAAAICLVIIGCSDTTRVATSPTTAAPDEVFWAKNQLAEQTAAPGAVRFPRFAVYALSNGDRAYCGDMSLPNAAGHTLGSVPFYMRSRAGVVKAIEADVSSAEFARETCADVRKGSMRIG
ncbi:hypothetical protein J7413_13375 [Shimia sp. R10_1]|uniref:hypothetical protein n=1 Tax=Shimia sp. R10_1 TaxID=2821095 RepID=UPI001ADCD69E|nr:hypothetical protein [Shimia sp. R10_1]MBO9474535.1 hypothetical protein [Shimia sp. R10_1]